MRPHTVRRPRLALGDGAATRVSEKLYMALCIYMYLYLYLDADRVAALRQHLFDPGVCWPLHDIAIASSVWYILQ